MMHVTFHNLQNIEDGDLKFAVIAAKYRDQWVFCRHKDRTTWECLGGHREAGEAIDETARRELWEETGAVRADIYPVCVYKVWNYGVLYYANILEREQIPKGSEIKEIILTDHIPEELTYMGIHDKLFAKVQLWLDNG